MNIRELQDWLGDNTSPQHQKILLESIELLRLQLGADFEEYIERVYLSFEGKENSDNLIELSNYLADFSRTAIQSYGVVLDEDADKAVNQRLLNSLLFTLQNVLVYEDVRAVWHIINQSDAPKEALFELVELLTGTDTLEIADIVDDFSSMTFKTLSKLISEQYQTVVEEDAIEEAEKSNQLRQENNALLEKIQKVLSANEETLHAILNGFMVVSEETYFDFFKDLMSEELNVMEEAKYWFVAVILFNIRDKKTNVEGKDRRTELLRYLERHTTNFNRLFSLNIQLDTLFNGSV